jgi:hypothetical protein
MTVRMRRAGEATQQDATGRQFKLAMADRTVVGVADIRVRGLEQTSEPQVSLPARQQPDNSFIFYLPKDRVIRASTPLNQLVPAVRSIVHAVDAQQPVSDVRPMTDIIDAQTASRTVQVRVLAGFAFVAFLLAAIGIHGVLSFAVSQRTPEIGVRIALGAQRRDILGMAMKQALLLVASGLTNPGPAARLLRRALAASASDRRHTRRCADVRDGNWPDTAHSTRRNVAANTSRAPNRSDQGETGRVGRRASGFSGF